MSVVSQDHKSFTFELTCIPNPRLQVSSALYFTLFMTTNGDSLEYLGLYWIFSQYCSIAFFFSSAVYGFWLYFDIAKMLVFCLCCCGGGRTKDDDARSECRSC